MVNDAKAYPYSPPPKTGSPPVSEQTLTILSVGGAGSGLPAGNDGFRAGVSSWRTQKTCPPESGHCRLEGRSTHPNPCLGGQQTRADPDIPANRGAHPLQRRNSSPDRETP